MLYEVITRSSGSLARISREANAAATLAGGSAAEKINDRALCATTSTSRWSPTTKPPTLASDLLIVPMTRSTSARARSRRLIKKKPMPSELSYNFV